MTLVLGNITSGEITFERLDQLPVTIWSILLQFFQSQGRYCYFIQMGNLSHYHDNNIKPFIPHYFLSVWKF